MPKWWVACSADPDDERLRRTLAPAVLATLPDVGGRFAAAGWADAVVVGQLVVGQERSGAWPHIAADVRLGAGRSRLEAMPDNGNRWGWLLVVLALLAYVLGRSQQIWLLEIGAFIPLLAGCGLLAKSSNF